MEPVIIIGILGLLTLFGAIGLLTYQYTQPPAKPKASAPKVSAPKPAVIPKLGDKFPVRKA